MRLCPLIFARTSSRSSAVSRAAAASRSGSTAGWEAMMGAQLGVGRGVQAQDERGLGRGGGAGQDGRGHPDPRRDDLRLLQAVHGRAVARVVEVVARGGEAVLVVEAAHGEDRRRGGRRQHGVARGVAQVAHRGAHQDAVARGLLRRLRQAVGQVRGLVVAPAAHVHDADPVALALAHHPLQAAPDVVVGDAPRAPALDEHEARLRGQAAVEAVRQAAVPAGHHRGHHAVPARGVRRLEVRAARPAARDVDVADDAVLRLHEVGVGVEAGVEEGDGDAPPAIPFATRPAAPRWAGSRGRWPAAAGNGCAGSRGRR